MTKKERSYRFSQKNDMNIWYRRRGCNDFPKKTTQYTYDKEGEVVKTSQ